MGWTYLATHERSEEDIQQYMNGWTKKVTRLSRAGAPDWLEAMTNLRPQIHCGTTLGYSFRPDMLAEANGEHFVLELKCARKYEPLALAEALHHAELLSSDLAFTKAGDSSLQYTPVLITQYSSWMRAALQRLRRYGLRPTAIKYVEFTSLHASNTKESLLWFDEALAEWDPCSEAPPLPDGLQLTGKHWYKVRGAPTWLAVDNALKRRPALWTQPYWMVTEDSPRRRTLPWDGAPTEPGRYLLWRSGEGISEKIIA